MKPLTFNLHYSKSSCILVIFVGRQNGYVYPLTKKLKVIEAMNCGNHVSFKFDPCILTCDINQIKHNKSFPQL